MGEIKKTLKERYWQKRVNKSVGSFLALILAFYGKRKRMLLGA